MILKKRIFILLFLLSLFNISSAQDKTNTTATYSEIYYYYQRLDEEFPEVSVQEIGMTDAGLPLQLVTISKDGMVNNFGKVSVLVNNGIHPGEPEGIDATMKLARDLVTNKDLKKYLDHMSIYIIPVYNIDGCLNRNSHSRANQNGPKEYGFRGNYQNLDLNRDFIKMDSKNAFAFAEIFHKVKPHIFIDTHTSNGADYQHVLTYIATQKDKLAPELSEYMTKNFQPVLDKNLANKKFPVVPYVNAWWQIPDSGWNAFYESPRYATGYAALFNCIGFTVETHMLKPFDIRLKATYEFLFEALKIIDQDKDKIIQVKRVADENVKTQTEFPLNWKIDKSDYTLINFKGYQAGYKKSEVSGKDRLYYDRSKPTSIKVKWYNEYKPADIIKRPQAYVVPQSWFRVIYRLQSNGVVMHQLVEDNELEVEVYYIEDYQTGSVYEGHYAHSNTRVRKEIQKVKFLKGDYMVMTGQANARFIIETLEPQAVDSYFNWNFFDSILGEKEYFSDYVFEDTAAELLKNDPALKTKLEEKRSSDPKFAESGNDQLEFIYRNSKYFEKSYLRYPVFRIN
jgi:hypothetical protein